MKNKVLLLIALIALGLLSSCGQNNNQKQKEDLSEYGNYYGDSDDPADEEFVDDGDDIAIRAVPINFWDYVFIFATTADGNSYYLYDDETNYENAVFAYVIIKKAFESTNREQLSSTTKKWNPYLTKVYDLPHISGVPNDLKEALVKAYYDYKDKLFYLEDKGYSALDLKLLYYTAHYRNFLDFNETVLEQSKIQRKNLIKKISKTERVDLK